MVKRFAHTEIYSRYMKSTAVTYLSASAAITVESIPPEKRTATLAGETTQSVEDEQGPDISGRSDVFLMLSALSKALSC